MKRSEARGIPERDVKREILLALGSRSDLRIWNNPTGVARTLDGRDVIRYGCPGSGDIAGLIGPRGRALWIEVKRSDGGKHEDQQQCFERMVRSLGGIYILARSVDECLQQIEAQR